MKQCTSRRGPSRRRRYERRESGVASERRPQRIARQLGGVIQLGNVSSGRSVAIAWSSSPVSMVHRLDQIWLNATAPSRVRRRHLDRCGGRRAPPRSARRSGSGHRLDRALGRVERAASRSSTRRSGRATSDRGGDATSAQWPSPGRRAIVLDRIRSCDLQQLRTPARIVQLATAPSSSSRGRARGPQVYVHQAVRRPGGPAARRSRERRRAGPGARPRPRPRSRPSRSRSRPASRGASSPTSSPSRAACWPARSRRSASRRAPSRTSCWRWREPCRTITSPCTSSAQHRGRDGAAARAAARSAEPHRRRAAATDRRRGSAAARDRAADLGGAPPARTAPATSGIERRRERRPPGHRRAPPLPDPGTAGRDRAPARERSARSARGLAWEARARRGARAGPAGAAGPGRGAAHVRHPGAARHSAPRGRGAGGPGGAGCARSASARRRCCGGSGWTPPR